MRLVAFFLIAAGFALPAGDPAGFYHWKSSDLKNMSAQLAPKLAASGFASDSMAKLENYSFGANLRRASGGAEIHKTNTDVFVVESGEATLIVGGTIPDAKESQPNEVRGTSISGGVEKKIAAGDVVTIAAGTPHQMKLDPGKEIAYLAIKIAKQ
jgi:mannose-6-phosphate isomerase-like protein (cupin superfamily)